MKATLTALRDVYEGLLQCDLWGRLGYMEVRRRYRRTIFGPFWATLNMGIFASTLGVLYSTLWHMEIETYLPYLMVGFITWAPIASVATEAGSSFTSAENVLKQLKVPFSVFIFATLWRNILVFGHHLVIYLLLFVFFTIPLGWVSLLALPGLLLLSLNLMWFGMLAATVCARYRDVQQLINNLVQIAMFLTPVFWPAGQLQGTRALIAQVNPLYHLIEIVRAPMLGQAPVALNWWVALGLAAVGWFVTLWLFSRVRGRITLWL